MLVSKLSVIVPVYNVEDYLQWSLGSLQNQTLHDIEIVCVNDGSTDSSLSLLADWSERDPRIVVVNKPNGGLSSARNLGIQVSTGDYVCFLDADDRLWPNACERIVSEFEETGADVITFGATCYPEGAAIDWIVEALSPRDVVYDSFSPDLLFKENSRPFVWRTACRRQVLIKDGISFDEGLRFGEDQVFDFALYPRVGKTVLISDKLYDYRVIRDGSLMASMRCDLASKQLEHVKIVEHILNDWSVGGFLGLCPRELIEFIADFALYDALKLADEDYSAVACSLRSCIFRHWTREEVVALELPRPIGKMILDACLDGCVSSAVRKLLVVEYYTYLHGIGATFAKLLSKA